jgi:uncharacterized protein YndB with AHSA1/START domain
MGRDGIEVSDDSVHRATGRTWNEWETMLDRWGAAELSHKEIVATLQERGGIDSGWWRQMVANGYEKAKGRRKTGETEDAGFQVGVQRTVHIPHERAWRLLTSPKGLRLWLGDMGKLKLKKGETYRAADGSKGEVRVVHREDRLRVTWHPEGWTRPSTIQVRVVPKGKKKTVITFHEEHLPGEEQREERRAHFKTALEAIRDLADD